ncbi:MAG: hypothetical protein Q8O00_02345, partial [Holophaga sp.]|nr:hypothetical protein [Holophaga sp.]
RHLAAVEALSKSTMLKADESKAWALLAISEAHLQRWKDSAAHFEIALRYQPYNATWWLDLAEACFHGGMEAAYQAALTKLDALDPKLAKEARAFKPRRAAR